MIEFLWFSLKMHHARDKKTSITAQERHVETRKLPHFITSDHNECQTTVYGAHYVIISKYINVYQILRLCAFLP